MKIPAQIDGNMKPVQGMSVETSNHLEVESFELLQSSVGPLKY